MNKGGRPKTSYNYNEVSIFGQHKGTYQSMADHFGVSVRTIEREMSNETGEFCRAYKKGLTNLQLKVSEAQVIEALKGNPTLLIWLGKQILGQKDKQEIEQSSEVKVIGLVEGWNEDES